MQTRTAYYTGKDTPNGRFLALLQRIEACYKQQDLHMLIFLTGMCLRNFQDCIRRTKLPKPTNDQNLSLTIYEKLMAIKMRNHEFKIKYLNMQANLSKQYCNNRRTTHQAKYQETMDKIREKSYEIREKLAQLKKEKGSNRLVINNENDKTNTATKELKQATEMLSHETLKLRAQFNTFKEMYPEVEFN